MTIAILGASGFLGSHLAAYLLKTTDYKVVAISKHDYDIKQEIRHDPRLQWVQADVFDEEQITEALQSVDVAYYFIHMMGQANKDFYGQEAVSAHRFSAAAIAAGVKRVIFMGGLGNDHEQLSEHLASRHNTGTLLRENLPLVIEFRASMIIGEGSVAFDIIRNLVHRLPVMVLPRWTKTLTQPIALADALDYLKQAAVLPISHHEIIEIGGPTTISYKDLYRLYAQNVGRHPVLIRIPFLPVQLGGWWLNLFIPSKHAKIGAIMVASMSNAMVVTHDRSEMLFPDIKPRTIQQAFDDVEQPLDT